MWKSVNFELGRCIRRRPNRLVIASKSPEWLWKVVQGVFLQKLSLRIFFYKVKIFEYICRFSCTMCLKVPKWLNFEQNQEKIIGCIDQTVAANQCTQLRWDEWSFGVILCKELIFRNFESMNLICGHQAHLKFPQFWKNFGKFKFFCKNQFKDTDVKICSKRLLEPGNVFLGCFYTK